MANVCERSPGEEVWDDSWHGIQTLLVWKSNLHTFDANSSRNKQASSQRVQIDFSHATAPHNSAIDTSVAGVPKSCDDSIFIDPRQSVAYGMRDRNCLVLDSQFTLRSS
ncbi:PREDICTED: POC1 centriolar protein homolog [Rhagoletis zephyria]|uniref:POC1 centriolar protein homolog n=1 Tax=Rhagoletis zephyria TaxID=28612 RepID=UPI000811967A|nr:PREDICTED: POC1 centriolar protein homolog [Rhagoletis zephyria]